MHLRQPRFTNSAQKAYKNKERIQKFKEIGASIYIYLNELDEACVQHDMAYEAIKDFPRRTASDKVLSDKAFNIAKNPKYDGYQRGLASLVQNSLGGAIKINLLLKVKLWQTKYQHKNYKK